MKNYFVLLSLVVFLVGCIGDDIVLDTVEEKVIILNPIDSLELNTEYQFEANFLNQTGQAESQTITWSSSDPNIFSIDANGLATGNAVGTAEVIAVANKPGSDPVEARQSLTVAETVTNPGGFIRTGSLQTTSSYALSGDFELIRENGEVSLELASNYVASSSLPGLYIYLTNKPSTISNALELGKVSVFQGAHSYALPESVEMNSYSHILYFCKPFGVKVGDGAFEN